MRYSDLHIALASGITVALQRFLVSRVLIADYLTDVDTLHFRERRIISSAAVRNSRKCRGVSDVRRYVAEFD